MNHRVLVGEGIEKPQIEVFLVKVHTRPYRAGWDILFCLFALFSASLSANVPSHWRGPLPNNGHTPGSAVVGMVTKRKADAPHLCLLWSFLPDGFNTKTDQENEADHHD
jgi:hypothetical protein